jgi:two-component system nitrate/nitrite response regulator NarL
MRRVLVIDDHEPSRNHLAKVLSESGFRVVGEATGGAAGVELASATMPDVVLMAVGLSDLQACAVRVRKVSGFGREQLK